MGHQINPALTDSLALLGEVHPLLEQLGAVDGLFALENAAFHLGLPRVDNAPALSRFLSTYRDQLLVPVELPAICQAHLHAAHSQCREMIGLDQQLGAQQVFEPFRAASRRVGRAWLNRLRPLRDERLTQRYLRAVESGRAQGWHTVVFGISLALYSIPLRQGLLHYASHTLTGFTRHAAKGLHLSSKDLRRLEREFSNDLPARLEPILAHPEISSLREI